MRSILAALALLAFAAPAMGQDVSSTREFGEWKLTCKIDGMTDKTTCSLYNFAKGRTRLQLPPPILFWRDWPRGPDIVIVEEAVRDQGAWFRVGRNAPAPLIPCDYRKASYCAASVSDGNRLPAEIEAGAETALLRVGTIDAGEDWVFDLSSLAEARAELRRLSAAIPAPTANPARENRATLLAAYRVAEQRCETLPRAQILTCKAAWADCVKTDPPTEAALETCLAKSRNDAKGIAARTSAR